MSIREFLRAGGVPFRLLLHRPAPSAERVAHSLHVPGARVAKAVLVRSESGFLLAVLPATHRVDLIALAGLLDGPPDALRIADESEVRAAFPDCEVGAVPPFGRLYGLPTFLDTQLAASSEIVVEANMRHESIRIRSRDYQAVEAPKLARFATPIAPRRRASPRRAG